MRPVRPTFMALALAASAALAPAAHAVVPFVHLTGPGPITSLNLGNDLSCQMTAAGDPSPSFEPVGSDLADCATYVLATNTATGEVTLFGPSDRVFIPGGDQPYTPDTSVGPTGQLSLPAGGGTTAVNTGVLLSPTPLSLLQTEVFNESQDLYSSGISVTNNDPSVAYDITVTHLFLCFLQGATSGDFGFHDVFSGSLERPGCITGPGVSPPRAETLTSITNPANWVVVPYGDTGTLLRAGAFPNTCLCGESSDLMVGLSWNRRVDPGSSVSDISWQTRSSGPQGAPAPQPEKTGTASTESGTVLVQAPGGQFVPLSGTQSITVGSLVDTTNGVVQLKAAASGKVKTRTGSFGGGIFRFTQKRQKVGSKRLLTTRLGLRGGNFGICKSRVEGGAARRRVVRYLKAKASGRFEVIGKNSSGIERGTRWTTSDTCAGTLTAVQQGTVAVTDFAKRKTVLVRAGKSYLARG